jgi:cytochrome c oxidase assembly protein subunit 15
MYSNSDKRDKIISAWLGMMCFCIVLMIFIGGVTRLTKSGLSITEWNPITGILPPLGEDSWNIEFEKYKSSPEYKNINFGISLDEFKSIYLIEFIHRIVGRITGILYVIPLLIFFLKGYIKQNELSIYLIGLGLFLSQGVMGWYMVKSGLVFDPHVSHYRLAAHLFLAVLLYTLFFWQFLKSKADIMLLPESVSVCSQKSWCMFAIIILFIQIIFGAFVAGLDAGRIYNEFPLMGGEFIPYELKISDLSLKSFSDSVFVQFIHRITAYFLSIIIVIFCIKGLKIGNKKFSSVLFYIFFSLIIQVLLGISTLIYNIPIELALLHQLGAILLLSSLIWAYFLLKVTHEKNNS